jgi:hypothetical protein
MLSSSKTLAALDYTEELLFSVSSWNAWGPEKGRLLTKVEREERRECCCQVRLLLPHEYTLLLMLSVSG